MGPYHVKGGVSTSPNSDKKGGPLGEGGPSMSKYGIYIYIQVCILHTNEMWWVIFCLLAFPSSQNRPLS